MDELIKFFEVFGLLILYSSEMIISKNCFKKSNRKNNYKLYKYGFNDIILSVSSFPKRSIKDILYYEELLDTDYPKELKDIFSKFVNYVNPENLEYSLFNLVSIKLENRRTFKDLLKIFTDDITLGYYDAFKNKINIIFNEKHVLSHEFLHMASTSYFNPHLCGFNIINCNNDSSFTNFGTGLNEGYTELLNSRIFYGGKKSKSYKLNVEIVKLLECFFDNPSDMQYAYFHNDINSVYKSFCQYGNRYEFFYVINELDNLTKLITPTDMKDYYKLKLKLYEIIKRSDDEKKISNFEKVLFNSPLTKIIYKKTR
ncbi:MAG: hypothetical protein IKF01_00885 [Bacilli bacterium]|nr:hypothetical protein [Bacilli bacterium]